MPEFVHLHTHSHYSLLDGLAKIDSLLNKTKEMGMDAIALTDHGNLYGAIEFYKKAKKLGIKPIIGVEGYLTLGSRHSKQAKVDDERFHIILLVKNSTGWKNLIKIVTLSYLEGFYYKPRMDKELLEKYHEGLICLSGCMSGEIPRLLQKNKLEEAENSAKWYKTIFGEDFYLEIQPHNDLAPLLKKISEKLEIPLVGTEDIHYIEEDDKTAHEILLAVQTNTKLDDPDRLSLKKYDLSLTSPETMAEKFKDYPEAVINTVAIALKCDLEIELGKNKLPKFPVPDNKNSFEYLQELINERIMNRYPKITPEIDERLKKELEVIQKTGFSDYFLIVQDYINWAKEHGIVVGPGRGSAAGSIVAYILGITNLDPLTYDLLFERFLNPDRIQVPDIDVDFTDTRRDEVLAYVREKYGEDNVAQIITFGTMMGRAAVRDAGRAMGLAYSFCDQIAKLIPFTAPPMPLIKALENVPELKKLYETNEDAKKVLDAAKKLEGTARHASVHACGVVISPEPLVNFLPLQHAPQDTSITITQFEMHSVEDLGLLKMDFLGLKNLTIIEKTLRLIKEIHGVDIDINKIPLKDEKTFAFLQSAETTGIFQLESSGMRRYLKDLKPTELEDIIAMVSLYRPGPMELIPSYIRRKFGKEEVVYLHPKLKPILAKTYGVGVYQEQMMRIARDLAGFTLAEADTLRKAIGKKIKKLLEEQKEKLINGMIKNDIPQNIAEAIWELFPPFARYGFNRCLSGDTKIFDPDSGSLIPIKEIFKKNIQLSSVVSLKEKELKLRRYCVNDIFFNGKKPVWELTTVSGRKIKTTANHPFYTVHGWLNLEKIKTGEKIAVPRVLQEPSSPLSVETHKLGMLGYLLAEGNFCHPHGFYFYSKQEDEVKDYTHFLEVFHNTIGKIDKSKSAIAVYAKRSNVNRQSEAVEWITVLGLKYKKATEKFFPPFVFQLKNSDLALLIGKMFQGDGCINIKRVNPQIFYATSSWLLACDLQHLFLRFGILSTIHTKKFKYRGGIKIGYTISISRFDNIEKFINAFAPHFVGEKKKIAETILKTHPIINQSIPEWSARGSYDIIPVSLVLPLLRETVLAKGITFRKFEREYGFSWRLFMADKKKIGYLRETIGAIAHSLSNQNLLQLSESDIYWDEIKNIKYVGTEDTYDLNIQESHNFVANDIIVHNSHGACYAMISYETAYLKAHYQQEFMASLLNVSGTDIERINFLVNETKRLGIEVLPPDINMSSEDFTVDDKNIRFGLSAIKNVGVNIVNIIIEERGRGGPFADLKDFLSRVHNRDLNKKSLESMIKCGVFDTFGIERGQILGNIEELLKFNQAIKKAAENQDNLFGTPVSFATLNLKPTTPTAKNDTLQWEKELLGLYLSDHPFKSFSVEAKGKFKSINEAMLASTQTIMPMIYTIGGIVAAVQKIVTKKGSPMAFVTIEDTESNIEILVFSETLAKTQNIWEVGKPVIIRGKFSDRNGEKKMICEDAKELEQT